MKSPVHPEVEMKKVEKFGVVIEYCPKSGGVWLERGELEKLLAVAKSQATHDEHDPMAPQIDDDREDHYDPRYPHRKKKKSFLSELFESFGD